MASTFKLNVITPERIYYSGDVTMVTAPGIAGEFGVLAGHAPFITTLKAGIVRVQGPEGGKRIAVLDGVAEVTQEHCAILAEVAQTVEDFDAAQAQQALQAARNALESAHTDELRVRAQDKLTLAQLIAAEF